MPKLTADTITDEQIVELHNESLRLSNFEIARACADALALSPKWSPDERREARARCAEILNARSAK